MEHHARDVITACNELNDILVYCDFEHQCRAVSYSATHEQLDSPCVLRVHTST